MGGVLRSILGVRGIGEKVTVREKKGLLGTKAQVQASIACRVL